MPESRDPLFSIWKSDAHKIERPTAAEPQATKMFKLALQFARNRAGATSIEYAVIAAGISIVIVASVQAVGGSTQGLFAAVLNALTAG